MIVFIDFPFWMVNLAPFSPLVPHETKVYFLIFLVDNFTRSVGITYVIMSQYAVSDDPFNKLFYTTLSF